MKERKDEETDALGKKKDVKSREQTPKEDKRGKRELAARRQSGGGGCLYIIGPTTDLREGEYLHKKRNL